MLENLCCGLWKGEGGQEGRTNFKSCWLRGWLIIPRQLKQNPTQMHLCWSLWIYTGWLLKGGKVGLCKCWSIYYAWKLKQFLIVPLSIIKPDGLDAAPHLGMSPARAWGCSPSAWLLLSSSPPHCPAQAPARMELWLTPYGSSFSLLQSNRAMRCAGSAAWSAKIFFFWWGQFPLVSKHPLEWSLNRCLVKRLVLW